MEISNPDPNPNSNLIGLSGTNIEDLLDELLIEIFIRLPSHETVITSKFVSKHWYSLLSDPKFVIRFVKHKKQNEKQGDVLPWTFLWSLRLIQFRHANNNKRLKTLIDDHNKLFSSSKYSLNFLPVKHIVAATFKDLVLCMDANHKDHRYYYICNPVTKHWVTLPPTPSPAPYDYQHDLDRSKACLVCEDPYDIELDDDKGERRCIDIHDYRFRIVVALSPCKLMPRNTFCTIKLMVFCSENCQWIEIDLKVPLNLHQWPCQRIPLKIVLCKGMVCVCYHEYFGMFDAFDTTLMISGTTSLEAKVLPIPSSFWKSMLLECGGRLISVQPIVFEGSHRLVEKEGFIQLVRKKEDISVQLLYKVLDLNQVGNNNDNEIEVHWMDYGCMCIDNTGRCRSVYSGIRLINIHPNNAQLIYLLTDENELLLCDRGSSSLKILGHCELISDQNYHLLQSFNKRLQLQYWPTPVPTILRSDSSKAESDHYCVPY